MKTIVEPKDYIDKVWGKQRVNENITYRLMKYVIRADHDDVVLLHNVVTGQLVVLEKKEAGIIDQLPVKYVPSLYQLVQRHFLVPVDYDEFEQVSKMKLILRRYDEAKQDSSITKYTILPTTACNARCYYCFEQGVVPITMTMDTAHNVASFIKHHCKMKRVFLSWFGGEPTLAVDRIDQICSELKSYGIEYTSEITTNGFLLDNNLILKAKELWKLNYVMICVDGTEENYNRVKRYKNVKTNPYKTVMHNIRLLLDNDITVLVRMNFDLNNYQDFTEFVKDAKRTFGCRKNLVVTAHPISGEYIDCSGKIQHGTDAWFEEKITELNDIANSAGMQDRISSLPSLDYKVCMAASDSSVTITAEGKLVRCPEQFGKDQWVGNLKDGVTNYALVKEWKTIATFDKCEDCVHFPSCVRITHCEAASRCSFKSDMLRLNKHIMIEKYTKYLQCI